MQEYIEITEIFASDVFTEDTMQRWLKPEIFQAWKNCVNNATALELPVANEIAEAMKNWALAKGATHYTHWFQPMTGITAEKHDSFIEVGEQGKVLLHFSGKALVRGEPDASSFPSGGLRATFEARGYTAWDPSAFAFVKDGSLYIPTCFFSYTGAALDQKTPLLRSIDEVSKEALRILRLFGDFETSRVIPCVGAEQEYFLLPKKLYEKRTDLRLTGRTLFGAPPPKGQELDDHYFGTIRTRVSLFMKDLDEQLWRLGIYAKTKHNEAAPCQHELAPIFTDANNACDANQLIMLIMKKCAAKHDMVCLLHEKPFQGVNGSGKHNNWSLTTNTGMNLFDPGTTPRHNARFLLFLTAFLSGIDEYQDYLRCTVCSAGNDHRLGGGEAPPAIVSIFLGEELTGIIQSIIDSTNYDSLPKSMLRIGVDAMPTIPKDTTDRNRTSPLAFTGNKFEFRMLGSSQSISDTNIALNTILADTLSKFADTLEASDNFEDALQKLICDTLKKHQRIIFNGNGYSSQWTQEAERRGLSNFASSADALTVYTDPKIICLVTGRKVFTEEEFRARYDVYTQSYKKHIMIEARTAIDMVFTQILPAAFTYTKMLCDTAHAKELYTTSNHAEHCLIHQLSAITDRLYQNTTALQDVLSKIPDGISEAAHYCKSVILPLMETIRADADQLERYADKSLWPYPTYSDLLYY